MAYKISSSTFSISSPVVIKNGTEGYGRILTTDASGLAVWKEPNSFFGTSRYIGELYGGGIVVDYWKEGDVENTLIMSLKHLSYDYVWSNIPTVTGDMLYNYRTLTNSIYDGKLNSDIITSQLVYANYENLDGSIPLLYTHTTSAAKLCKDYNYEGYEDWYLPSYDEFNSIVKNKHIINRVLGDVDGIRSQNTGSGSALNGLYWTSNEYTDTVISYTPLPIFTATYYAIQYSTSEGKFKAASKTSNAMVRAVRREQSITGNGLVLSLDAGNKNSYDDSTKGNVWYDLVNKGITASAGLTFSASATGVTFSATNSGYLTFQNNTTSYIDFKVNLDNSTIVTVEMFARLKNKNAVGNIFGWGLPGSSQYSVLQSGSAVGFWTGNIYGIDYTTSNDYGLIDNWRHYVFVMSSVPEIPAYASNKIYINGDKINLTFVQGTTEGTKSFVNGYGRINVDQGGYGLGAGMDLAVFNIYKRELNQTEIVNNFNKYKKRFEVKDIPYQKDIILNLNSNNINSFNPTNLTVWNDTKLASDTRTLKPVTFVSTPTYTVSGGVYPGTYINFNANRASVASSIAFTYSTTWEAWVKFDSNQTYAGVNFIMGQTLPYFGVSKASNYKILFSNSFSGAAGGGSQTYHYSNSSATFSVWYHLAFTTKYDPVSNTTSSRIYINGNPDYSNTITTNPDSSGVTYDSNSIPGYQNPNTYGTTFAIGDGRNTGWQPFNGSIAEVRIYNRTLTSVEIKNSYNSSKHLYDIDKNHYTHNFNTSPTFSIFQNLTLNFPNKQNNSILVSDGNGLVSLSTPSVIVTGKNIKRSVGDLYGGGIIVSVVDYSSTTNYLIASLEDLSTTYYWSTLSGSQSSDTLGCDEYNGSNNTSIIKTSYGLGSYAAATASAYNYGGYTDWYLPSSNELREAYNNSNIINLVLGKNSLQGTYWSSTESTYGEISGPAQVVYRDAFAFNFGSQEASYPSSISGLGVDGATSSGLEFLVRKYNKLKVRPFRFINNDVAFAIVIKTDNPGASDANSIIIPTSPSYTYNYIVDWGDGSKSSGLTADSTHTYTNPGTYTIKITGTFPTIFFNNQLDCLKLLEVKKWGSNKWSNMSYSFYGCQNLTITALDAPDLSNVTNMQNTFTDCVSLNQSINHWDVSTITNFQQTFYGCTIFNQPLNSWNVSSATNMLGMFMSAQAFNQPLNSWNVSNVTMMGAMFRGCIVFNQPLNSWNVSNVTFMSYMFCGASAFNQPLNSWNVSNVTNMSFMFENANIFNQTLSNWNTLAVTDMSYMFHNASAFNQPLTTNGNLWNVSNVTSFGGMFAGASVFNQSLNSWNTSAVTNMSNMFDSATSFNNGLSSGVSGPLNFDTHLVTNMSFMFVSATSFNQSLTTSGNIWKVSNVTDMSFMFNGAALFNQPLNSWDTSGVTTMYAMFPNTIFNQPLNLWNTISVTNMGYMFISSSFNQPINSWNTSAVTNMDYMFHNNISFNQPLNSWNTSAVTNMRSMFDGSIFNQNIGSWNVSNVTDFTNFMLGKTPITLSTTNLDAIYIGWSSRSVKPNKTITFGSAKRTSASTTARGILTASPNFWTITDGGI